MPARLFLILAFVLALGSLGCSQNAEALGNAPLIAQILVDGAPATPGTSVVLTGGRGVPLNVSLLAGVSGPRYQWDVSAGDVTPNNQATATWAAPALAGTYAIDIGVTGNVQGVGNFQTMRITVVIP